MAAKNLEAAKTMIELLYTFQDGLYNIMYNIDLPDRLDVYPNKTVKGPFAKFDPNFYFNLGEKVWSPFTRSFRLLREATATRERGNTSKIEYEVVQANINVNQVFTPFINNLEAMYCKESGSCYNADRLLKHFVHVFDRYNATIHGLIRDLMNNFNHPSTVDRTHNEVKALYDATTKPGAVSDHKNIVEYLRDQFIAVNTALEQLATDIQSKQGPVQPAAPSLAQQQQAVIITYLQHADAQTKQIMAEYNEAMTKGDITKLNEVIVKCTQFMHVYIKLPPELQEALKAYGDEIKKIGTHATSVVQLVEEQQAAAAYAAQQQAAAAHAAQQQAAAAYAAQQQAAAAYAAQQQAAAAYAAQQQADTQHRKNVAAASRGKGNNGMAGRTHKMEYNNNNDDEEDPNVGGGRRRYIKNTHRRRKQRKQRKQRKATNRRRSN